VHYGVHRFLGSIGKIYRTCRHSALRRRLVYAHSCILAAAMLYLYHCHSGSSSHYRRQQSYKKYIFLHTCFSYTLKLKNCFSNALSNFVPQPIGLQFCHHLDIY